ncbi:MAG TPA: zinc ribbon domain-containing protein [Thermoplasmata archaeon]|nr:zinc ribbon domain-containing protein [Thermoplasmata archaeon]
MQAGRCPNCGAPLTPGASFCSFCGTAVPMGGTAPLPSGGAPNAPPAYPPVPAYAPAAPPRRARGRLVIAVILVVVLLIVAVIAVAYFLFPAPAIQVQAINIWAPDNVCGLNANPIYFFGYNGSTGSVVSLVLGMPNFNTTTCTIESAVTNSSGFTLSGVGTPLTIPGSGTGPMNVTITSPSSPFTGTINLVLA